ncbi:YqjF family protein [Marinoscillum sp. MHG1-6]|uniref:YqjF family protein n=1 Tax=Marinoscillum sp. MHG1-6 TaxID=2959627 RepID=UPI002157085A|nr:DUF2071 domain-containing protein [Marinoscillum sp. MHG1-6]
MTNKELLRTTEHRPWPLPNEQWKYYQEWNRAIFLHWQVDEQILRELVPEPLELDSFEGTTWVSLVAFTMENVRPRILPSFGPISNFDEVNIRTYVRPNNKPGVYFLSIESGKHLSTWIAKTISELPYRYSNINRTSNNYTTVNEEYGDNLSIDYETLEPLTNKTDLDKWLTERYALYQDSGSRINKYEIHHLEWPIEKISIKNLTCEYLRFEQLLSGQPDLAHWSNGVKVIAWDKEKTGYNRR